MFCLGARPWRSWIARVTPTHKAAGSNPVGRTNMCYKTDTQQKCRTKVRHFCVMKQKGG